MRSMRPGIVAAVALVALFGCERAAHEPASGPKNRPKPTPAATAPAAEHSTPDAPAPPAPAQPASERPAAQGDRAGVLEPQGAFRLPGAERVIAIGDLHGDFVATEKAFRLGGAIDETGHWAGGKLIVVQTGDQLDRGDDERSILDFLERLQGEASAAGGSVVVLNGNHETMNVMGDYRYVTPGALHSFDGLEPPAPLASRVSGPYKSRASAFLPGGGGAQLLSRRDLVVMVGDTIFVHGGLLPGHVEYGIDRLNQETKDWIAGKAPLPPAPVVDPEGPLWTRIYGGPAVTPVACAVLERTLKMLGAARMAIGHTVQLSGMSSACDDKVFRIDVGLAAHYGDRAVQVLEIANGAAKILTAPN